MFKVVRGNPTPEELAAALAVVQATAAATAAGLAPDEDGTGTEWSDPASTIPSRRLPHPGPRSWRTSYWPR
ncbi:acyl-CoA carboxylase epsilon subunit [Streptomyces sp. NPDC048644]|uniref:acyl-CoA carboxylase epsilon subunit n=1 Tax=Streptomyces sp. NPDC048644 TaxID=3365582 RepID=UPI003719ADEA